MRYGHRRNSTESIYSIIRYRRSSQNLKEPGFFSQKDGPALLLFTVSPEEVFIVDSLDFPVKLTYPLDSVGKQTRDYFQT